MTPMLYLAPVDWASIRQRPQQLALRFAERYALTYFNTVGLRSVRLQDAGRMLRRVKGVVGEAAPFPVISPQYVPVLGWPPLDRLNRRWLFAQSRPSVPDGREPWILWLGAPSLLAESLLQRSRPDLVVYDCMDRYGAFHRGRTQARIDRAEQAIVERADLVFATSRGLAERLRKFSANVHLAPNGVDLDRFAIERPTEPPAWRRRMRGPVIGYHGTIGDWLDFPLLEWIADRRRDWSFVFLGPHAASRSRAFFSRPNVHLLGPVPYAELPQHTAWFDAGIVPFEQNDLTLHVHPIKALEYLAAGLPTVSTELPDLVELGRSIRFAETPQQWLAALEDSLDSSARTHERAEARRQAVAHGAWERVADSIAERLDSALVRSSAPTKTPRPPAAAERAA